MELLSKWKRVSSMLVFFMTLFPNPKYIMKVHVSLILFNIPASHSTHFWTERWIFSMENICNVVCKNLFCGRILNPFPAVSHLYISCACVVSSYWQDELLWIGYTEHSLFLELFLDPKPELVKVSNCFCSNTALHHCFQGMLLLCSFILSLLLNLCST